jgi:AraC-like DNA-binding protein
MAFKPERFSEVVSLMEQYAFEIDLNKGWGDIDVDNLQWGSYKIKQPHPLMPFIDIPAFWFVGQGKKFSYSGGKRYAYTPGKALIMFYPMAVETEIVEASPEKPFMAAGLVLHMTRMLEVLQRIERIEGASQKTSSAKPSAILSVELTDELIDPFLRLFQSLRNPTDAAILTDGILDEVYYRLLTGEKGMELRYLLRQRGEILRISRAIEYLHQHIDEPVSVEKLAELVHMAQPTFYENFRSVMHTSPLKYAKSIKLSHAQQLIRQGKKANEAGYLVGYSSPAQFSREYKRHFGYAPSMTM